MSVWLLSFSLVHRDYKRIALPNGEVLGEAGDDLEELVVEGHNAYELGDLYLKIRITVRITLKPHCYF